MVSISQAAFTGGEITPRLNARDELPRYQSGLSKLMNAIVWPHGGIARRMGTQFIDPARENAKTRLIPFYRSRDDAYVLAFSAGYMRVFRNRGAVLTTGDATYEITTPYLEADLDGIDYVQSADTIFLTHPLHPVQQLVRADHDDWTLSAYSFSGVTFGAGNYPRSAAFFQQRLVFAGSPNSPKTLWFSRTGDLDAFSGGSGTAQAFSYVFDADDNSTIRWARANRNGLLIGTDGGLWTISPPDQSSGFGQDNIIGKRGSKYGVGAERPAVVDQNVYFFSQARTKIREARFDFSEDSYKARDKTLYAEHLGRIGLNQLTYHEEPDGVLWSIGDDGSVVGATLQSDEEVTAFHQHILGGQFGREYPVVESLCVIPAPTGTHQDLWMVVKRTIGGSTVRHIEHLQTPYNPLSDTDRDGIWYVDAGLRARTELTPDFTLTATDYTSRAGTLTASANHFSATGELIRLRSFTARGELHFVDVRVKTVTSATAAEVDILADDVPALLRGFAADEALSPLSSISAGLEHLNGETVQVSVDGAAHPDRVVVDGGFDLDFPGFNIVAGLPFTTEAISLDLLSEGPQGSARPLKKRIVRVDVDLYRSQGAQIGVEGEALETIPERDVIDQMGRPPALFSGVLRVNVEGGHDFIRRVRIVQDRPLPLHVRAIIPKLEA